MKMLISANYFKGELQGSELWNVLKDRATSAFVESRRIEYILSDTTRPSFASQVDAVVAS